MQITQKLSANIFQLADSYTQPFIYNGFPQLPQNFVAGEFDTPHDVQNFDDCDVEDDELKEDDEQPFPLTTVSAIAITLSSSLAC